MEEKADNTVIIKEFTNISNKEALKDKIHEIHNFINMTV